MNRALLAGVAVILAAGCASTGGGGQVSSEIPVPDFLPRCDEIFVGGGIVDRQTFGDACRSADDDLVVPRPAVVECDDGRELVWNDLAWGYVGEGMQVWEAEEEDRVPVDQAMECIGSPAPAGQAPSEGQSNASDTESN